MKFFFKIPILILHKNQVIALNGDDLEPKLLGEAASAVEPMALFL